MKKIIFMGRSGCGKTTLTQALRGGTLTYHKTQYINHYGHIIDTPGEYAENHELGRALALYTYEAELVGLLLSAAEPYSLYPPNVTCQANREVIGIVTQIDRPDANPDRAERWLRLSGCRRVFRVSARTGEGIPALLSYLKEDGELLPWENQKNQTETKKNKEILLTNAEKSGKLNE